jgi:Uncharacterized protein conserved in bacteria
MHRSGTSSIAQILNNAGLRVGTRLLAANDFNRNGYFENLDFVEFHKAVLIDHGINHDGWTLEGSFTFSDKLRQQAQVLVDNNSQTEPWGWKDPRTTLFLDFWAQQLPECKFLFVHRAPWEVVDSLFRRGDATFQADPILALRVWEHYNRLVIAFIKKHPDRTLLVDIKAIRYSSDEVIAAISDKFAMPLTSPKESLFDDSLMKKRVETSHWPLLIKQLFPQICQLWEELKQLSLPLSVDRAAEVPISQEEFAQLVLQDWMESRKTEYELAAVQNDLEQARTDLYHANEHIKYVENSRLWKMRNKLRDIRRPFPSST